MGSDRAVERDGVRGATESNLAPDRVLMRATVAQLLSDAIRARVAAGDGACTMRAIARRMKTSHTHVERWASADSGRAIALGDLMAMPRDLARETLVRCLGVLEPSGGTGARDTLDAITVALGVAVSDLARDLADGRMDEPEKHRTHLCRIGGLALRGYLALGGAP